MMVVLEVMAEALEWSSHPSWGPVSFPTVDSGSLEGAKGPARPFSVEGSQHCLHIGSPSVPPLYRSFVQPADFDHLLCARSWALRD